MYVRVNAYILHPLDEVSYCFLLFYLKRKLNYLLKAPCIEFGLKFLYTEKLNFITAFLTPKAALLVRD